MCGVLQNFTHNQIIDIIVPSYINECVFLNNCNEVHNAYINIRCMTLELCECVFTCLGPHKTLDRLP